MDSGSFRKIQLPQGTVRDGAKGTYINMWTLTHMDFQQLAQALVFISVHNDIIGDSSDITTCYQSNYWIKLETPRPLTMEPTT